MKVIVFGATGMVGEQLVIKSLGQGYAVKAYGRNVLEKLTPIDHLELVPGSVFDEVDIRKALKGCDAVFSALGGGIDGTDHTRSLGIKKIVTEMEVAGIKRIIAIGGTGCLDGADGKLISEDPDFPEEYLPVTKEHLKALDTLKSSSLDWTFVCPPMITEAAAKGNYITGKDTLPEGSNNISTITAADLAAFMVEELAQGEFIQSRVGVANR